MSKAGYLGSFGGFTNGHQDVVEQLSAHFDEVIVGIGVNPSKTNPEFSLAELEANARHILRHLPNVTVKFYSGLFTDFLEEQRVDVLVRGLRNGREYDSQIDMELYDQWARTKEDQGRTPGRNGQRRRTTLYIPATPGNEFISSTMVKAVLREHGDAEGLAPASTIAQLMARIEKQYPYGITGVSGAGKGHICRKFKEIADQLCLPLYHADIDLIAHDILGDREEPDYVALRKEIGAAFGHEVVNADGSIDRAKLGPILFSDPQKMRLYDDMMRRPVLRLLRKNLNRRKGILLLDSALFAEAGLSHLANRNVLVVDAALDTRIARLKKRQNLTSAQIRRRAKSQFTTDNKVNIIKESIAAADYGSVQTLVSDARTTGNDVRTAFNVMLENIDIFGELRITGFFARQGLVEPEKAYNTIRQLYGDNVRRYHALAHIVDGLNIIQKFEGQIDTPKAFILAWLFHDSVYDPARSKEDKAIKPDEDRSAETMEACARQWGFDEKTIAYASNLIRHTQHGKMDPVTNDEKLFVDLDMSVMGRPPEVFARCENELRIEYGIYTQASWIKGRTTFLQSLSVGSIFHTPFFKNLYEKQAMENIANSLAALKAARAPQSTQGSGLFP